MYLPPYHALNGRDAMHDHIDAHPLGAWVCQGFDGLEANHLPWVLDRGRGAYGTLLGHVARGNPVWPQLASGAPSVVMFMGPQAYISPNWYPGKAAHGKVVPTWNYVAVHAHGTARAVEDRDWLRNMLRRLTEANEAAQPQPWRVEDAPADFIDKLMAAIVGIEIVIDRLEGRNKASQDEDLQDRCGTVAGLRARGGDQAAAVADQVEAAMRTQRP